MNIARWLGIVALVGAVAAFAACGSSGDDDDSGSNGNANSSANGSGGGGGGSSSVKFDKVADGAFASGKLQLEISGDRDQKSELEGGGVVQSGFMLLTYAATDNSASAALTFASDGSDGPGGFSFTAKELATAGEWGKECKASYKEAGSQIKGEFSCDKIDAIQPGGTKTYKIRLKGTFTVNR